MTKAAETQRKAGKTQKRAVPRRPPLGEPSPLYPSDATAGDPRLILLSP